MTTRLIKNIGELTTNDPTLGAGTAGRLHDAAMVIDEDEFSGLGPTRRRRPLTSRLTRRIARSFPASSTPYPLGLRR